VVEVVKQVLSPELIEDMCLELRGSAMYYDFAYRGLVRSARLHAGSTFHELLRE
jgi:hypothetical protein